MTTKIGINGFGRIGRLTLRAIVERNSSDLEVVAINDLVEPEVNANLLKYDSNYGVWDHDVRATDNGIVVDGKEIRVTAEREPAKIPWGDAGVDIVAECSGFFTDATQAKDHRRDGVKKVIISAPAKNEDATFVLGVNDEKYDPNQHHIISNASCTTNGLAPIVKVIVDNLGIQKGQMTTIHSYTNSQKILDQAGGKDPREMRAGGLNIVPTSTGAARALRLVIPEVEGKLDGLAYRVPTPTVSIVEVVALTDKETTEEALNGMVQETASEQMKGILGFTTEPLVSMDLKGDERSSIVDSISTKVVGGNLVKLAAWYDNEWGYACRIGDLCTFVAKKGL